MSRPIRSINRPISIWHTRLAFLFLIPGIAFFLFFNLYPILYAISMSFTNTSGYNIMADINYIGLANFRELLTGLGSRFFYVVGRSLLFMAVSVPLKVAAGLAFALLLNSELLKGRGFWRGLAIIPWAVPAFFSILTWRGMFAAGELGTINQLLNYAGLRGINWLFDSTNAFIAYNTVEVWLAYPFMMTMILAAMQSIPPDLYESSSMDGAGTWAKFRYITLPLIKRPLLFATTLTSIASFTMFQIAFLLNQGGPARTNELVMVHGYKEAFHSAGLRYAYAASFQVLVSLMVIILIILSLKASRLTREV